MLLTKVPGLPQSIEIDQRLDKKFRQGFALLGPLLQHEGVRTSDRLQCLVFPEWDEFVPFLGWGVCVQGSGQWGGLSVWPTP